MVFDEILDDSRIVVKRAGVETQVCGIEDGKETLLCDDVRDTLPLSPRGVASRRIMRARVEHNSRVWLRRAERLREGLKVEGSGLVVGDLLDVEADVPELGVMNGPGRVGDVDCVDGLVNLSEGEPDDEEGARAREGLAGCDLRFSLSINDADALSTVGNDLPFPPSVQLYL